MSGGVDSSVTAALMLEAGHQVFGVTMCLFGGVNEGDKAQEAADHLGIPHHVVDCSEVFTERVLRFCWDEYARGRTPNPCVICNRHVKFGVLFEAARRLGAGKLATGHHARLLPGLARGRDRDKDQSYFLARLSAEQLSCALFPIGEMTKAEIRDAARARGLPSAEHKESQDTCVALAVEGEREGAFAETLRLRFGEPSQPGEIVNGEGDRKVLGHHRGLHLFTIGQRRGLGVSLGRRAYVVALDPARGQVVLTTDRQALQAIGMSVSDFRWHLDPAPVSSLRCQVQIRYRSRPIGAVASCLDGDALFVDFLEPVTAVTPGQTAVLYAKEEVLGCGWIKDAVSGVGH